MSEKLPPQWAWVNMLDILDYEGGTQPPKKQFIYEPRKGYVRLLQIRDFGDKPFPTYIPDSRRLKKATCDDLLLARYGGSSANDSLGRICTGLEGAYNVALAKLIFSRHLLDKNYVKYLFMGPWFREKVSKKSRSCQTGFNRDDLVDILFPIAPLSEQHRIAAKLEKLLPKVEACQERFNKITSILKRFRQSVLAAACAGRLTAEWRKDDTSENNIPVNWKATKLGELTSLVTSGSRGWARYYSQKGAIFIRAQNINADYLDLSDIAYVDLPNRTEGLRTKVTKDDLLVTITGANVAKSAIVLEDLDNAYVSQHVSLVRLKDTKMSLFVYYWLLSPAHGRAQLLESAYGQGKPGLNLDNIRNIDVWIPTDAEQKEIVRRVEGLFKIADQIEKHYKKAKAYIDKLTQSIIAKAFRGELVNQTDIHCDQATSL